MFDLTTKSYDCLLDDKFALQYILRKNVMVPLRCFTTIISS